MIHNLQPSIRGPAKEATGDFLNGSHPGSGIRSSVSATQLLQLQQAALESAANPVVITDANGFILWTNPAFTQLTGYTAAEALGRTPRILKSGQHDSALYGELWRTIKSGRTWSGELTNRRKNGQLYYGHQTITPVGAESGEIGHFVAVMNDVTARREGEMAVRVTHLQLKQLLDHSPVAIYGAKWEGGRIVPTHVSESVALMLGIPTTDLTYDWWLEHLHPDDRDRAVASIDEVVAQGECVVQYRLRHRDGSYRWIEDQCRLVRGAAGCPDEMTGVLTDLTERRRAEEVIRGGAQKRSAEWRLRAVRDTVLVVAGALAVFAANRYFGWSILSDEKHHPLFDDLGGTAWFVVLAMLFFSVRRHRERQAEIVSQQNIAAALQALHAELDGRVQQRTAELARANQELRAEAIERKRVESALEQERSLLRTMIDQIPDLIYVKDAEGRFLVANDAVARLMGVAAPAELLGRTDAEFHPAECAAQFRADERRVIAGEPLIAKEEVATDGSGRVFLTSKLPRRDPTGRIVGLIGVAHEITERKKLEDALSLREAELGSFFSGATAGMVQLDRDLRYMRINSTLAEMHALPVEAHLGRTVAEVIPGLSPTVEPLLRQVLETNQPLLDLEISGEFARASGTKRSWLESIFPVRGANAEVVGVGAVVVEITQRKRMEEALRETEARFRQLAENIAEVFWLFDPVRRELLYVSPGYERIWGRSCASLLASPQEWQDAIHPDDRGRVARAAQHDSETLYDEEYRVIRPDGEVRWIHDRAFPVRSETGEICRLAGVAVDITDRRRAATALQEAKDQYQSIFQHAREGIFQTTPDGRFLAANPAMARILGFASADELMSARRSIGRQGYVDPQRRDEFIRAIERNGLVTGFEYEAYRKDGSRVWVSENARVVRNSDGTITHYEGSLTDVTERRRAEERLKLQHAVTQALAEIGTLEVASSRILEIVGRNLQWPVGEWWTLDADRKQLRLFDAWHPPSSEFTRAFAASRRKAFPRGEGLPGRVWELGRAEWVPDIAVDHGCRERLTPLGLSSWVGFPVKLRQETLGVIGFFSTQVQEPDAEMVATLAALGTQLGQFVERLRLAEQFRHAQKMEAVGTLAGGIAHDFNNILAAISGYSELARLETAGNAAVTHHLDAVLTASARATMLVRQILAFSRQHEQQRQPIQLRHIVSEAVNMLRATVPATIEFDFSFAHGLPAVLADATQVHQVVMNLGTNAWHAMKDRPGRLTVRLEPWMVDAELAMSHPALRAGPYVRLSVSDTGHGMDAETLGRIFEPFFTTKAPGEGTGLGLAVVHGVMHAHEGAVTVYSQPGEGTIFRLYFPADAGETAETVPQVASLPHGRGERLMFVDDEAPLAAMGKKVLERLGYVVDAYTKPVEALEAVRSAPGQHALVITDLAMPVMNGTDLAKELLTLRPDLPIVVSTGFTSTLTTGRIRAMGIRELVAKPMTVESLAKLVHRILAGPAEAGTQEGRPSAGESAPA